MRIGITALEDEAHRRAFAGVPEPLTHQGQFTYLYEEAKDEDGNAIVDDLTGQPQMRRAFNPDGTPKLATVNKYSDTLAIFLLKAHDPDKYRENVKVEHSGSVDIAQTIVAARKRAGAG